MKNLIRLTDLSVDDIHKIFNIADNINDNKYSEILKGKTAVMFFPDSSIRTRVTFETGWDVCECLFVGDSLVDDVKGPQNIGMKAALLDRNHKYSDSSDIKPDYIIHSLSELTEIVKKY